MGGHTKKTSRDVLGLRRLSYMQRHAATLCITQRSSRRPTRYAACPPLSLVVRQIHMTWTRVVLLVLAIEMTAAYGETPKPMADNVLALTEAAAVLNICFESTAYEQLDTDTALQLHDLEMRLTSLVERISSRYDDESLYFTYEMMRVKMSADLELQKYVRDKYQYCGRSLFSDMSEYVAETESQLNQFLRAQSGTPSKEVWPQSVKSSYIDRCASSMSSQGLDGTTARAYCTCIATGMEKEFGMKEYNEMMRAQPDPNGSRYDRRVYRVFQSCASVLPR